MGMSMMDRFRDQGAANGSQRRILVYLLLDISGSMRGAPLAAVQDGVDFLARELRNVPEAIEMAHICVITFGAEAAIATPLTPVADFNPPALEAGGSTNMSAALRLLDARLEADFRPNRVGQVQGDYKPLIFLFTDGRPNNVVAAERAVQQILHRPSGKTVGTFLALGCGPDTDMEALGRIAPRTALMREMTPENIRQYFKWLTASLARVSRRASMAGGDIGDNDTLAPAPRDASGNPLF